MGFKSKILRPYARKVSRDIQRWSQRAVEAQHKIRSGLIRQAVATRFGVDHRFSSIATYDDFKSLIPVRDYEGLRPYVDSILKGGKNVLWPGKPKYLAKTSGTTSGVKYIPLTKESLPNHFGTARNAVMNYAVKSGEFGFFDGKMIFLSGSPEMQQTAGIPTGRLSGIVNHQIPSWLRTNQLPSYKTNCIEDWETKLSAIVKETADQPMTLISGIPPWVQMYFEWLLKHTGASDIKSLFPDFSVFVYGGVNYEPYRGSIEKLIGSSVHTIETYPASEGFIAFQDSPGHDGLLLNADSGIFFEFIPADTYFDETPQRLSLDQVEKGVNYALLLSTNAGLWAYDIGDTIEFVSLDPFKIRVTGRVKHYISAFGEHVISKEVEQAMNVACKALGASIVEFTVAPQVTPQDGGLPYHEWFVEFEKAPQNLAAFCEALNAEMVQQNIYYKDLMKGHILRPLVLRILEKDAFRNYMKSQGKLGGQNKVPRLTNDRKMADALKPYLISS
jgi:hypothetical protein